MKQPPMIDTPVIVWHEGYEKWPQRFHSAGQFDIYGNLMVYEQGKTSWSAQGRIHYTGFEHWKAAR